MSALKFRSPLKPFLFVLLIVVALGMALVVTAGVTIARGLRPAANATCFPAQLVEELGLSTHTTVEVKAPSVLFAGARLAAKFVDLEPEAKAALSVLRGAEVGVYEVTSSHGQSVSGDLMKASDAYLGRSGFERLVRVMDDSETILVYISFVDDKSDIIKICVLVLSDRELVVASVSGRLEPLMELASATLSEHRDDHQFNW